MTKRTWIITIAIFLLAMGTLAWLTTRKPSPHSSTLRVGVNLPLTGPIAVFMEPIPRGLKDGVLDEAGASGRPIEFDVQDNGGTPAGAVSAYRAQSQRGFDVYVSGSSEMSSPILEALDRSRTPHFLVAFDAFMVDRGKDRLRVLPNYKMEAPLWIKAVAERGSKRVAVLTLNNAPIQEEFGSLIIPKLQRSGVQVDQQKFEWEGTNFALLVQKALASNPDMILVSGYSVHLLPIKLEINRQDRRQTPVIMALDYVDLLHSGTELKQLVGAQFMCPDFELRNPGSLAATWADKWRLRYGSDPTYPAAYAYDLGRLIAKAALRSARPTHADFLKAQPFTGVTGALSLDEHGDLVSTLSVCVLNNEHRATRVFK